MQCPYLIVSLIDVGWLSPTKQNLSLNLSKKKSQIKTLDGEKWKCAFFLFVFLVFFLFFCFFLLHWPALDKMNKHEQKKSVEMVVIRSAGLSTKQQQGSLRPLFTPLVDDNAMEGEKKKLFFLLLYIIITWLLCKCLLVFVSA